MLTESRISSRREGRGMTITRRMATTPTAMDSSLRSIQEVFLAGAAETGRLFLSHRSISYRVLFFIR